MHPATVNGTRDAVIAPAGRPVLVMAFTIRNGKITFGTAVTCRA